jgi:hypothetical protein
VKITVTVYDHPIPDSYWVQHGALLAGEYPGALTDGAALQKLAALLDAGVTLFVDLTEQDEYGLRPYFLLAQRIAATRGQPLAHRRLSIPDMGVTTPTQLTAILDVIDAAMADGQVVYVHCYGGIGRTGTVIGCWLVRHGQTGEQALATIAERRRHIPDGWRRSPETEAQTRMVLTWPAV